MMIHPDQNWSIDGYIRINGGKTTLMTTGGVDESDYSSACCAKADSIFIMNKGELYCKSTGIGGKGIKANLHDLLSFCDL